MLLLSLFNSAQLFEILWNIAHQVPLSMGFFRQEYWSGLNTSGDLPNPWTEITSLSLLHRHDSLPPVPSGKPIWNLATHNSAFQFSSVQFRSVQLLSRVQLCDPMNRSTPGLPVHHQLLEFTQIHVHRVSDAIQPSHPLSSPSTPAPNPSQHQSLF